MWSISPLHKRLEAGIGYVPEDRKLFGEMTVRENVEVAKIGAQAAGREVMDVDQFLPELARFYDRKSKLLSGGQQKMVSIARAIVASPQVLLFDELLEGLAQAMCYKICDAVKRLKAEEKIFSARVKLGQGKHLCGQSDLAGTGKNCCHGNSGRDQEADDGTHPQNAGGAKAPSRGSLS